MEAKTQPQPATSSVIPLNLTGKTNVERIKEITEQLEEGIKALFASDRYAEYLTVMSKFHGYSFRNILLIMAQKPDASLIAGYQDWQRKFKRHVRYGEKGLKVLAPAPYKTRRKVQQYDPTTHQPMTTPDGRPITAEQEITVPCYKIVTVFDVSQTEGDPLPTLGADELTGSVERYQDFFAALEKVSPVPVAFEDIPGEAHGYYHLTDKRIAIQQNMSELQTLKTAIHEIAHAVLHSLPEDGSDPQDRPDQRTREVQAESVAYTVCQHYGLDTSDYSFGYVAGWSTGRALSELKSSLAIIRQTAHGLIAAINACLAPQPPQDVPPPTDIPSAAVQLYDLLHGAAPDEWQSADQIAALLDSGQYDGLDASLSDIIIRSRDLDRLARASVLSDWLHSFREQQPTQKPKPKAKRRSRKKKEATA